MRATRLRTPAVPIEGSVQYEKKICLECGGPLRILKRHSEEIHGWTPDEYRPAFGLPADYSTRCHHTAGFSIAPLAVGGAASAEAAFSAASDALARELADIGEATVAGVRARANEALEAERRIEEVERRITERCEADPALGMAVGADALSAYVTAEQGAKDDSASGDGDCSDLAGLEAALLGAEEDEQRATGRHDGVRDLLKEVEARH